MIDRRYGKIVFICDECEAEEFETSSSDFQEALEEFKSDSEGSEWVIMNDDGEWRHICSACAQIV